MPVFISFTLLIFAGYWYIHFFKIFESQSLWIDKQAMIIIARSNLSMVLSRLLDLDLNGLLISNNQTHITWLFILD